MGFAFLEHISSPSLEFDVLVPGAFTKWEDLSLRTDRACFFRVTSLAAKWMKGCKATGLRLTSQSCAESGTAQN